MAAGVTRPVARVPLVLSGQQRSILSELVGSRVARQREVERAMVLLAYVNGQTPTQDQRVLGMSRPTICACINMALGAGMMAGRRGRYPRTGAPEPVNEAKAWMSDLVGQRPSDTGLAAKLWTLSGTAKHVAAHASEAAVPRLDNADNAIV